MKIIRSALPVLAAALLLPSAAFALVLEDNFNRPGPNPGPTWTASAGSTWEIENDRLHHRRGGTGGADEVISFTSFSLADTPSFTTTADIQITRNTGWGGLAFNVVDAQNFYAFRVRPSTNVWQVVSVTGGTTALITGATGTVAGGIVNTETYRFTVHSPSVSNYEVTLQAINSDGSAGATLGSYSFSHSAFAGQGYAGFFAVRTTSADVDVLFADNFSLQVIPEPATVAAVFGLAVLGLALGRRHLRQRRS